MLYEIHQFDDIVRNDNYPHCTLTRGNFCNDDPKLQYCLSWNGGKTVYFREKWQAYLYIANYLRTDTNGQYSVVESKNVKETDDIEIFDPGVFNFVKPDDETRDKFQYTYTTNQLLLDIEFLLESYSDWNSKIKVLINRCKSKYNQRPQLFKKMWNSGYIYAQRKKDFGKELFKEIVDLVDNTKDDKNIALYKTYDIIQHKTENSFLIVMDVCIKDGEYYVDDYDGETFVRKFEYIHDNYKKIGEVTYDVLKKANPNLKDKNEID